ncbi:hypothetical protein RHSIM_Rhsim13G0235100 [Rhododendron simsii]|uniref:Kinesin motor domain-containing protein n=1 Tax=Rhododendron simsii TaxID=118357 RepID=A0A834G5C4_RHOSS|nr:hypothetical protein RHSIM_Rhsim13G0235100 [Rhododendron simsii]
MTMDYRKSSHSLAESIHSLLGSKTHLITPSWVDSVCNIIRSSPSHQRGRHHHHDHEDDYKKGLAILKIQDELAALNANICQLNIQRRQVLNDFLDLKGNIRVFCRVRPITMGDNCYPLRPVVALDSNRLALNFAKNKSKIYSFDKVFHPSSSQDEVFEEVEPVIKSALDGYNACIFAYGQTGTGKTFTMEGTADHPGVIPRAMEALFKQAADSNHPFLFSFSMLEIYMGYLKDLLVPRTTKATEHMPPCLSIQTDSEGEIEINNLATIQVSDFNQAKRLYTMGRRSRSTASTNSNQSSSRSHCMTRILMTCFDANTRRRITNKIWMVDLGGSERVLKTKAMGRRFEEGKAINLSLSALGDVINALHRKNSHIPYRNSKLTQVLKDSLGDDSKTLMLVHVSPKEEDLCEAICSLNFATRARSIHLGNEESNEAKVQREVEMNSLQYRMKWIEDKRQDIRREIQMLNEKLEDLTGRPPSSSKQLEVSHLSFELEEPQSNIETVKKFGNVMAALPLKLPRFMRPTLCSRRKSGVDRQTSAENDGKAVKTRRPKPYHAESVSLPMNGTAEYNSESIISRNSCLGLELKCTPDNETEGSQEKSECDIKTVVFPIQDKLPRAPNGKTADHSCGQTQRNRKKNYINSPKLINIDDWLQSNKYAHGTISSTHQNKRVLVIPHPEKNRRGSLRSKLEELHDGKVNDYKLSKNKTNHDKIKKLAKVGAPGTSRSEVMAMPTLIKNFSNEGSRSNSSSTTYTNNDSCGTSTPPANCGIYSNDYFSAEENVCGTSTSPANCGGIIKEKKDESGVNCLQVQLIESETKFSEPLMLNTSWTSIHSALDVSGGTTTAVIDSGVSISRSEQRPTYHEVPNEIGNKGEDKTMHISLHHSGPRKLQQRNLHLDKANEVDIAMPIQSQGQSMIAGEKSEAQ